MTMSDTALRDGLDRIEDACCELEEAARSGLDVTTGRQLTEYAMALRSLARNARHRQQKQAAAEAREARRVERWDGRPPVRAVPASPTRRGAILPDDPSKNPTNPGATVDPY